MIQALAAQGGVVQLSFGSIFLHLPPHEWTHQRDEALDFAVRAGRVAPGTDAALAFRAEYAAANPYPFATLDQVLDHIDHLVALVGVAHVGIGSDYDGVGDTLPIGLKDVAAFPNLIAGLLERGYAEADIEKILGRNLMRVWEAVENYAKRGGMEPLCVGY